MVVMVPEVANTTDNEIHVTIKFWYYHQSVSCETTKADDNHRPVINSSFKCEIDLDREHAAASAIIFWVWVPWISL